MINWRNERYQVMRAIIAGFVPGCAVLALRLVFISCDGA
jgi:hypothetical protein